MADPNAKKEASRFTPISSDAEWRAQGWAVEPEPLAADPRLSVTVTIHLEPDEVDLLRNAARRSGKTRAAFVRDAVIAAAVDSAELDENGPSNGPARRLESPQVPAETGRGEFDPSDGEPESPPRAAVPSTRRRKAS